MAPKQKLLAAALSLFFFLQIVSSASPPSIRNKRDVANDIENFGNDIKNPKPRTKSFFFVKGIKVENPYRKIQNREQHRNLEVAKSSWRPNMNPPFGFTFEYLESRKYKCDT